MKRISIKKMSLLNFKGIRELEINFREDITSVLGRNGSGKTTLFDAFTWVLFGKDSRDRKQFDIKTLDGNGVAIPRLPHEVTLWLDINGEPLTLTRRYCEKWQKKRGSATEEFCGHEEERLYNDVPCSAKEWGEKIAALCSEDVFKFITNPSYFVMQKWEVQRELLLRIIGGISDHDVAEATGRADFAELLDTLTNKTMDEYKREIGAKKKRIKDEIAGIPNRIDERKRDAETLADIDFAALEAELNEKKVALTDIERQMSDVSARYEAQEQAAQDIYKQIHALEKEKDALRKSVYSEMAQSSFNKCAHRDRLKERKRNIERRISDLRSEVTSRASEIARLSAAREECLAEWRKIQAETFDFNVGDMICPTCKRPLDPADMEVKVAEMRAAFNTRKAEQLKANADKGHTCSKQLIASLQQQNEGVEQNIAVLETELSAIAIPTDEECGSLPDIEAVEAEVTSRAKYITAEQRIAALQASLTVPDAIGNAEDTEELRDAKNTLQDAISTLIVKLAKRDELKRNKDRIVVLEQMLRQQNNELAKLEGAEFLMAEFTKAKIELVESRINALFSKVRFKMYAKQVNGGEVETCEAMVDGVPYSSLNNAGKINAGLDIINAICKFEEITAPVFIDNAEAVNVLTPMQSQVIRLVVTEDAKLTTGANITAC